MGTDVYMEVEAYKSPSEKWERISPTGDFKEGWYPGRNYSLFSLLADVRNTPRTYTNYHKVFKDAPGLCNIQMIKPISPNRGLPEGVSPSIKSSLEDRYSITWYTVKELLEFDWDQMAGEQDSIATVEGYKEFKNLTYTYVSACGGIGGSVILTHEEMDRLIEGDTSNLPALDDMWKRYATVIQWEETYRQAADTWFFKLLDDLAKRFEDTSKVRLVMGFD